ncbi:MAG: hypothetical protein ACYDDA_04995 [Acidiferrobacteraceae bacterium]
MTLDARLAIAEEIISPHQLNGRVAIDAIREARQALKDVLLPGWFCEACRVWTGTEKGATACRACGKDRTR